MSRVLFPGLSYSVRLRFTQIQVFSFLKNASKRFTECYHFVDGEFVFSSFSSFTFSCLPFLDYPLNIVFHISILVLHRKDINTSICLR